MPKRALEETDTVSPRSPKRARSTHAHDCNRDRLSTLSTELLLRILSFLPIHDLNTTQLLSHKFKHLASDSQLWKSLYYTRFVRPRASRLPGDLTAQHLTYSHKLSKWLDEENLLHRGGREGTNWKRQYRLRHNWAKGACRVEEIQVAETPPLPPLLVRMSGRVVYTVDSAGGLRAWSLKGKKRGQLAGIGLGSTSRPSALGVDLAGDGGVQTIVVGFEDGAFAIFTFDAKSALLRDRYAHAPSSNGLLSAVAVCGSYIVTMTASQLLSLYKFPTASTAPTGDKDGTIQLESAPQLLHSLRSHTTYPPLSLSIRSSSSNTTLVATIAYALPTYAQGWSVGVQELWLSPSGEVLSSRLATSTTASALGSDGGIFAAAQPGYAKPTSLSYSHPYLLLSHPDNTLTLYLVTSTTEKLEIGRPSRLWGHTSCVSGAHVGVRGKAVSVSARGDELRIWELEGTGRRGAGPSVRVQVPVVRTTSANALDLLGLTDAIAKRGTGAGCAIESRRCDVTDTVRGWVGFDEENVVVLKERSAGSQALVVYDFT